MQFLLYNAAPVIYLLTIAFSAWIGFMASRQHRGTNIQPIVAIFAGLATCPLVAVFLNLGRLNLPNIDIILPMICLTLAVGFFAGFIYIWSAGLVLDNIAMTSLYVLGTVGGSSICLYFYFFYDQVQDLLISAAWGFLFGVLVYMVIRGGIRGTVSRFRR